MLSIADAMTVHLLARAHVTGDVITHVLTMAFPPVSRGLSYEMRLIVGVLEFTVF